MGRSGGSHEKERVLTPCRLKSSVKKARAVSRNDSFNPPYNPTTSQPHGLVCTILHPTSNLSKAGPNLTLPLAVWISTFPYKSSSHVFAMFLAST